MATAAPPTARTSSRATFSCIRCGERKVKCDRQRPCNACVKHNADCVYAPSKPSGARKKHKRVKVQVLTDRLNQYEALLQKHGIVRSELETTVGQQMPSRPSHFPDETQLPTPSSLETEQTQGSNSHEYRSHGEFVEKYGLSLQICLQELTSTQQLVEESGRRGQYRLIRLRTRVRFNLLTCTTRNNSMFTVEGPV
jgi:hypothetical protein